MPRAWSRISSKVMADPPPRWRVRHRMASAASTSPSMVEHREYTRSTRGWKNKFTGLRSSGQETCRAEGLSHLLTLSPTRCPRVYRLASALHEVTPTYRPSSRSSTLGRADTAPRDAHPFVKNVPRLTLHGHERASLRPRDVGDTFYKVAEGQPNICNDVKESLIPVCHAQCGVPD